MRRKYLMPVMLLLGSASAFADTNKFIEVDADGDGAVTQAELEAAGLNSSLATADANNDGSLSQAEYEASMKSHTSAAGPLGTDKTDKTTGTESYSD